MLIKKRISESPTKDRNGNTFNVSVGTSAVQDIILTYDGNGNAKYIWISAGTKVYRVDISDPTNMVVDPAGGITVTGTPKAMTFDGTNVWVVCTTEGSFGTLKTIHKDTLTVTSIYAPSSGAVLKSNIGYGDNNYVYFSKNTDGLYKILKDSPFTVSVVSSAATVFDGDMVMAGGYLYIAGRSSANQVAKLDPTNDTFFATNLSSASSHLFSDGVDVWKGLSSGGSANIHKVIPSGTSSVTVCQSPLGYADSVGVTPWDRVNGEATRLWYITSNTGDYLVKIDLNGYVRVVYSDTHPSPWSGVQTLEKFTCSVNVADPKYVFLILSTSTTRYLMAVENK